MPNISISLCIHGTWISCNNITSIIIDLMNRLYKMYTTFLGYQSSEDKFKDRIRKKFDPYGDGSKIVIGYGNWGLNPNALKNGAPKPGIGLRRRIHSTFQTYPINERGPTVPAPFGGAGVKYVSYQNRGHFL